MKAKELIQRLQCLDPESEVWFYFGEDYSFLKYYAMTLLNRERQGRLNPTKEGISRNILPVDFSIKRELGNSDEHAAITFEPNIAIDSFAEESEYWQHVQLRTNVHIPELDGFDTASRGEGEVDIDGEKVKTKLQEIASANILTVEVGTNGYHGGDSGHGGRTYLRIKDDSSTDLRCRVIANGEVHSFDSACGVNQIEIMLGGDCELDTFTEALSFAADTLEQQAHALTIEQRRQIAANLADPKTTGKD